MTESEVPSASPRFRNPHWNDPKLLVGILLILIAVVATVFVVRATDSRSGYWVAAQDASPGSIVTAENFAVVEANLSEANGRYWPAHEDLPEKFVVSATVRQGEFLPRGSVYRSDPQNRQPLTLTVNDPISPTLSAGSRVDVWISWPEESGGGFQAAQQTLSSVEVTKIDELATGFAGQMTQNVHVLIPHSEMANLLHAQSAQARVSVVPALVVED